MLRFAELPDEQLISTDNKNYIKQCINTTEGIVVDSSGVYFMLQGEAEQTACINDHIEIHQERAVVEEPAREAVHAKKTPSIFRMSSVIEDETPNDSDITPDATKEINTHGSAALLSQFGLPAIHHQVPQTAVTTPATGYTPSQQG